MVAARFHARDQWNEMKKRRTSNIRRRRVPLQPGFRSWRFARRQRNRRFTSDFTCSIAAGKP